MSGEAKRTSATREYTVLSRDASGYWTEKGVGKGSSARAAVVDLLGPDDLEGTFVAVPARSWRPMTRKVETVVKAGWS